MKERISGFFRRITGPRLDIRTKIFVMLTLIGMVALSLALITDIIIGENLVEIIMLIVTLAVVPVHPSIASRTARAICFTDVYEVP